MRSVEIEITTKKRIQDATKAAALSSSPCSLGAGIQLTIVQAESDQIVFLKPGSRAWAEAWKGLLQFAGCVVARNADTGDRWEYVGTYKGHNEFRHKNHPQSGERLYARVATDTCSSNEGIVWSGTPYYEEGSEVSLKKDCPLKALYRPGDG